ncbi:MAG: hypothetical protein QXU21_07490 [Candidatus Bathyarchaeia archaeon]
MELTVKVDRQGRTVLPKEVRQAIGINGNAEMVCRVVGNKIVLERFSIDSIRKAFEELEEIAPSLELDTVKIEGEDKYIDREYALRKIGL